MTPKGLRAWVSGGLRRRLLVTLSAVMAALSLLFLGVVIETWRGRILAAQERAASQFNGLLQASLENAMLKRDLHGLQDILADLARRPGIARVQVLNPAFEVRFASHPELIGTVLDPGTLSQDLLTNPGTTRISQTDARDQTLRAATSVPNRSACRACHGDAAETPVNGILVVDYSADSLGDEARRGLALLLGLGLAMIAATGLTGWWALSRSVIAPVAGLNRAMEGLGDSGTGARLEMSGNDEIARLSKGFNRMADRLAASMAALRASQARLQAVIDAIPDGIRVMGADYRIVMANAAYADQSGLPAAAIPGQPCHALSHGRSTPCPETLVRCPIAELGPDRPSLTCRQIHHLTPDRETHVEIAAAWVETPDGPWVIEAIRDLHLQAQLGQEHRLAELALLAAGLAHEIHNPLASITLVVDALSADLAQGLDTASKDRLALLRAEIARTVDLTNALLTLCQPPGPPQLLRLVDVLPSTLEILGFLAQGKNARLHLDCPPDLRVLVAESDLRLAVTNLVQNALHAIAPQGEVRVTARRLADQVIIKVLDNGCGIAPQDLARVTLPFWTRRADGSQGRGLGLTLVQSAMERAKGRMEIASTLGKGSCFTLVFPDPDHKQELPA